jgi:hypothetical protein
MVAIGLGDQELKIYLDNANVEVPFLFLIPMSRSSLITFSTFILSAVRTPLTDFSKSLLNSAF